MTGLDMVHIQMSEARTSLGCPRHTCQWMSGMATQQVSLAQSQLSGPEVEVVTTVSSGS